MAYAGRVSLAVKGAKLAIKAGAKEVAKEAAEKALKEEAEALARRYGQRAVLQAEAVAEKGGLKKATALRLLKEHGEVLAQHNFSSEAFEFAQRHGGAGVFFLRHPELFEGLKRSTDVSGVPKAVIDRAWRWGDDKAIGGSLGRLQESLTKSGMNYGNSRDFCEELFLVKAQGGRMPGIPQGTAIFKGHIGDSRFGNDFYAVQPGGKFRVIEFGTGRKPEAGELDWTRIRSRLAKYLESLTPNQRINLREAGASPELVNNPMRILDADFPIEKYIQREVYAVQINKAEVARAGSDVIWHELP
jgi:hypothetical protein